MGKAFGMQARGPGEFRRDVTLRSSPGHPVPGCLPSQALHGIRRAQRPGAQAGTRRGEVGIAGVLDPAKARRRKRAAQPAGLDMQQGAKQPDRIQMGDGGHARLPSRTTAGGAAHPRRLRLVAGVVGDQKVHKASLLAGLRQQRVACQPGAFGDGRASVQAGLQQPGGNAEFRQPLQRQRRLPFRFRPQAMIHDQRLRPAPSGE